MDSRKPPEKPIHDPQFSNMRDVYAETLKMLAKPFPALQLPEWTLWNKMTGGLRVNEFTVFCGVTGGGKTTFLANLSAQLLKSGTKHFVMSVETGRHDYMARILSVLASRDLNTGDAVAAEVLAKLHVQNAKYLESDAIEFSHYENRVSVGQVMQDLAFMVKRGCKVAMIDNLNFLMEVTCAKDQIVEMDRVIHDLIIFCKHHPLHLIMVMHPKKTDHGRVESEYDIKGSSTAVQEAQNVFLWNRPKKDRIASGDASPYDRELFVAKMRRRGPCVGKTLIFESVGTAYREKGVL